MKRRTLAWLIAVVLTPALPGADATETLFEAARSGDAAKLKAALEQGVDVNAKWRYDTTAVMMAARRGHAEIVRLLLDKGADPNGKDSFYGMTPVSGSSGPQRAEIVKMLIEKGAKDRDAALMIGVTAGNVDLVKTVLAAGEIQAEALSTALGRAITSKNEPIAEVLRKAGAVPPRMADFQVDVETLKSYAGTYKGENFDLIFVVEDGKLKGGPTGQSWPMGAFDKVTFRPMQFEGLTVTFMLEGDKVTAVTMKQGNNSLVLKREVK